jgi:hypothetical protein
VHCSRDQFLSSPRLSIDQHRGVGWRDRLNIAYDAAQGFALAYDICETKLCVDLGFLHILSPHLGINSSCSNIEPGPTLLKAHFEPSSSHFVRLG